VRGIVWKTAGLCLVTLMGTTRAGTPPDKPEATCGKYGTSVEFVSTPSEAAQQAKKEQKLVFVLHVSGYFEDPKLT
jgi:hypothetical protein